jgi:RNA polymerase sigma-70 factor (ECF subfamily)
MSSARYTCMTTPELMRLVQGDDTEAFAALYDRLAARALRVARGVMSRDDHAGDVVQDAFLSVWRARAAYQSERSDVHVWVFGIVRNRAIDSIRRNRRHEHAREYCEGAAEKLSAPGSMEGEVILRDQAKELRLALTGLPVAQREVIALAYFGELSHTEIALELALPVGTIKGRMRLGLTKLRREIAA